MMCRGLISLALHVIQAPNWRHESLTDYEWAAIKPMTAEQAARRARVNDRRVLNGIFWGVKL